MNTPGYALALLLAAAPVFAQEAPPEPAEEVRRASALVDEGKLAEGIAILEKVAAAHPANDDAAYELALAYGAKGEFGKCRATAEPLAAKPGERQIGAIGLLANCYDSLGQPKKAIEVYRRGLAIAPDDAVLLYNLALTLHDTKELDEARALLERNGRTNPAHVSTHLLLGQTFAEQGFRTAAILSYLRFLALEPVSRRSPAAAAAVQQLLNLGVEKTKQGANITIDTSSRKEEGDYSAFEMMLGIVSAGRLADDKEKKTPFEMTRGHLASVLALFLESADAKRTDYTAQVQVPFFAELEKQKLLETYAGVAIASLNLDGTQPWLKENRANVQKYGEWVDAHSSRRPVQFAPRK